MNSNGINFNIKIRYVFCSLIIIYLVICQSCMRMRYSEKETKSFFDSSHVVYLDRTLKFTDHEIHYIQTGDEQNPTLFFIHGSPGSWSAFSQYLKDTLLLQQYRMIAIDRPGFGFSNFGDAQNLDKEAKWIAEFIKTIDNKKGICLVGHSLGGSVVVKLAVENPSWYEHLVILSGSIDPKAETPEKWRAVIKSIPLRYLIPGAFRPANDELWWLKKDLVKLQPDLKNNIGNVIIIHGKKDQLVPYSNVSFMQKEFINAKSVTIIPIENANHFIPWEHYKEIRDVLYALHWN
jgi:pimeloyl-ACP methyl ester carboxylesterase